jgi:hypothetical protein
VRPADSASSRADSVQTAGYIVDLLKSLRALAEEARLHFLAYLLSLALEEARQHLNRRA